MSKDFLVTETRSACLLRSRSVAQRTVFVRNNGCQGMCWRASPCVLLVLGSFILAALFCHFPALVFAVAILQPVTESARTRSYISGKQVQETCSLWLLTVWQ